MRWTSQAAACLAAMALAGCSCRDRARETGAAPGAAPGTETGATSDTAGTVAQPDMTRDTTGMGGMPVDTLQPATRPDQNEPVTSKGDTLNPGVDSAR